MGTPMADNGGSNVRVVVRVRTFLQRGMTPMSNSQLSLY